jgi:hypothetical protein
VVELLFALSGDPATCGESSTAHGNEGRPRVLSPSMNHTGHVGSEGDEFADRV